MRGDWPACHSIGGVRGHGALWRFSWATGDYLALAASYPFRWFASMDYCVEPEIARHREEVLDRISRTIRANFDCRSGARDLGIEHRLMPVIQGGGLRIMSAALTASRLTMAARA
jgi:hypothetical protein